MRLDQHLPAVRVPLDIPALSAGVRRSQGAGLPAVQEADRNRREPELAKTAEHVKTNLATLQHAMRDRLK